MAVCESGGWGRGTGGTYVGDLGLTTANWYQFGGGGDTSPAAQIAVAERFIAYYGMGIPDQNGTCAGY